MTFALYPIKSSIDGRVLYSSCKNPYSIIGAPCHDWFFDFNNPVSGTAQFPGERLERPDKPYAEVGEGKNLGMLTPDNDPRNDDDIAHFTLFTTYTSTYHLCGAEPIDCIVNSVVERIEVVSENEKIFHVMYTARAKYSLVIYSCKVGLNPWSAFPWRLCWSGKVVYCTGWSPYKFVDTDELVAIRAKVTCVRRPAFSYLPSPNNEYVWEVQKVEYKDNPALAGSSSISPSPICVSKEHKDVNELIAM